MRMKNSLIAILICIIIVSLAGCSKSNDELQTDERIPNLVIVSEASFKKVGVVTIYEDTNTGVMYFTITRHGRVTMSPLLDDKGKPIINEDGNNDQD